MSNETINTIAQLVTIVGGVGAAIGFVLGFRQYRKGQNWQRAQIVISLIDSFEEDKQIELACTMLDWDEREIALPGKESTRVLQFKNEMLVSALRVPEMDIASFGQKSANDEKGAFTEEESIIRDAFDAFFDFFHKLYALQEGGLLSFSDYVYFYYWLELIRDIGNYKKDQRIKSALDNYIDSYRFIGIKELLRQYQKKPDIIPIMKNDETL
ncbi:MAG: hypothetical protein WBV70_02955 [Candidatus Bathyarchaeia archaeon]